MRNSGGHEPDVVVVGGGPAGLTAALYLGRARKEVVVVDAGNPRHAVSDGVHNFLTRDGLPPAELRREAWAQMAAYPSVGRVDDRVETLSRDGERWIVQTKAHGELRARALLLATGVVDQHPEIDGYAARWGHAIHHCPYCHGWEMKDQPLAVLAHGDAATHLAPLLQGWSDDVMLLTNGVSLDAATRSALEAAGIPVHEAPIASLQGPDNELHAVVLENGTTLERRGLFVAADQKQVPLVERLGLDQTDDGYVQVDVFGATSLPMVWAAGDLTSRLQQVVEAAAQGARAGAMINMSLMH